MSEVAPQSLKVFCDEQFRMVAERLTGLHCDNEVPTLDQEQRRRVIGDALLRVNAISDVIKSLPDNIDEIIREWQAANPIEPVRKEIKLTNDQQKAWNKLSVWAFNDKPYFVLRGYPGTGKSFLLQLLMELGVSIFFSAPTNKAADVLTNLVHTPAKTTYSLLGLKMTEKEDQLVMEYGKKTPYFPKNAIIVVDECSMVNKQLLEFIEKVRKDYQVKVLYVGDPAQLNPVGERISKSFKVTDDPECRAFLKQVYRYGGPLLGLSIRIRRHLEAKDFRSPVFHDVEQKTGKGVHLVSSKRKFEREILHFTTPHDFKERKVLAWRNKTVTRYNDMIRDNFGFTEKFEVGDLILIADPIKNEDDEIIASIDDEYEVKQVRLVDVSAEPAISGKQVKCHQLIVENAKQALTLNVPVKSKQLDDILGYYSMMASNTKDKEERRVNWRKFWNVKNRFHSVRYAYAMTNHRVQGSTLHTVYVDQYDIMLNPEGPEALRGLMVAFSRPTHSAYTY